MNLGCRSREHGFDRTITTVAHPALQAAFTRLVLDEGTVSDPLNPAAHNDMTDNTIAHANSPASMTRAPVQRDADNRSSDRMYDSGNFHPRAAAATICIYPGRGFPGALRRSM